MGFIYQAASDINGWIGNLFISELKMCSRIVVLKNSIALCMLNVFSTYTEYPLGFVLLSSDSDSG
jgi:hypothetical protein